MKYLKSVLLPRKLLNPQNQKDTLGKFGGDLQARASLFAREEVVWGG
jgi:hypothetical protein